MVFAGCAPKDFDDPITAMLDRERVPDHRLHAARQAEKEQFDDPARLAGLEMLAWTRGHPIRLRQYAVNQLVAIDEDSFRRDLTLRIARLHSHELLAFVFKLAIDRGWPETTALVVQNYSRAIPAIPDTQRLEHTLLQELHPDQLVPQISFEVLEGVHTRTSLSQQAAAWQLLNRFLDGNDLFNYLNKALPTTGMIRDLKAGATDLRVLPHNKQQLLWLTYLRDPIHKPYWDAARILIASLNPQQRDRLALRHLKPLLVSDPSTLDMSHAQLWRDIQSRLTGTEHHFTKSQRQGSSRKDLQAFSVWGPTLSWADLVVIRLLLHILKDKSLAVEWFRQADIDVTDLESEHGGVLDQKGKRYLAKSYDPWMRCHNRKYVASPRLIEHLYTAVAHYHFHAQTTRNTEGAAPGRGDQRFADRWGFNCLVLSFIDRNRLNVDYYGPEGVEIDLGTLYR